MRETRFRGTRQFVGNVVGVGCGTVLLIVLIVSESVNPISSESTLLVITSLGLVAMIAIGVRIPLASTVEVTSEALIYRTLFRTRRFPRNEIVSIDRSLRYRAAVQLMQPCLTLRSGQIVWLTELGMGKAIAPNSKMQERLLVTVGQWLKDA
jgi:hypothetical protein